MLWAPEPCPRASPLGAPHAQEERAGSRLLLACQPLPH